MILLEMKAPSVSASVLVFIPTQAFSPLADLVCLVSIGELTITETSMNLSSEPLCQYSLGTTLILGAGR